MNDFVAAWNALGSAWLGWLATRSLAGLVALAAVLLVLAALPTRRCSAHLPAGLLLLPLLALALPVERALPGLPWARVPAATSLGDLVAIAPEPPAAMALAGGPDAQAWRAALHEALLDHRIVADGAAHWPAIDAWSHPGMEAYTTAAALLALRSLR